MYTNSNILWITVVFKFFSENDITFFFFNDKIIRSLILGYFYLIFKFVIKNLVHFMEN